MPDMNKAPRWATHLIIRISDGVFWWINKETRQWSVANASRLFKDPALSCNIVTFFSNPNYKREPIITQLEND